MKSRFGFDRIGDIYMNQQKTVENKYIPADIEAKWQEKWKSDNTFSPDIKAAKNPYFNLMMFPYPSAEGLHVGNMYAFTGADVYAKFQRMQGKDVLEPIGLDGFGIHSENYALKVGRHPKEQAEIAEKNFYRQMRSIGNSFDWNRTVETYDPNYYKWTQWLFVTLFKAGLAYRDTALVNWCPKDMTVLSDEQVIEGCCERCGTKVEKKNLEQWFFRITKYADRLLKNIDGLDWSNKVKIAQTNWIGKSEGAEVNFRVQGTEDSYDLKVFTTRPDTLYGATFMVIAPEHALAQQVVNGKWSMANGNEVKKYIESVKDKTDIERTGEGKEKTGVDSGLTAINPVNGEALPIWIADYVLSGYGTGAIMAVPAHDTRDFEFAKKYNLPIKQVIMPENGNPNPTETRRDGGAGVIFDPKTQKYAVFLSPIRNNFIGLFSGGTEEGEDEERGVLREVTEESGLHNFKYVEKISQAFAHFYSGGRKSYRSAKASGYLVILEDTDLLPPKHEEHEKFQLVWRTPEEILENWYAYEDLEGIRHWERFLKQGVARAIELGYDKTRKTSEFNTSSYDGKGILINSGEWNGFNTPQDMGKVLEDLENRKIGFRKSNFHLRDWLISRQRYWGPPIPMIFCSSCQKKGKAEVEGMEGWFTVPEEQLPVLLPDVEDWKPMGTGKAPLANHPEFYKTTCPSCGGEAERETDVSDTFLDSSWYFLRYPSSDIATAPFDIETTRKWLPVNMYIGGAEHSVLHLLYSRFVTMVLSDLGYLSFEEPFSTFFAHGLIIKDGAKMSKSKGNVVVPDEYIGKYGADTLRTYLMFIGPYSDGGDFRDSGIEGMNRFLRKVWKLLSPSSSENTQMTAERTMMMHKTIQGVTKDIFEFGYNTAIAKLMEWYNYLNQEVRVNNQELSREEVEVYLKLIAPFAPHLSEELWQALGDRKQGTGFSSIHLSSWPEFDEKHLISSSIVIPIQINGKRRGEIEIQKEKMKEQKEVEANATKAIAKHLEGQTIKKVIYVPGKIINFVI